MSAPTDLPVQALTAHRGPYFGRFGGRFVPEALVAALDELDREFTAAM
ncbi:MAG: tryptophan synthase subunit beta, partial [Actinobacteria bacterium]|nr:tryptophan synthase subunit beta [Actinomycetota bacterium]